MRGSRRIKAIADCGLRISRGVRQGALLIALGAVLGTAVNGIRAGGLPWMGDWSQESVAARHLQGMAEISLTEAWALHKDGKALFLDARDPSNFHDGHLPGAMNIPPGEAEASAEEVKAMAEAGLQRIACCDGLECPLGPTLAQTLHDGGVVSVRVLVNGWSRWRQAGYPTEAGSGL